MEHSGQSHHACITLNPIKDHKYSLIWLHGLTADATAFVKEFLDPALNVIPANCKVIMPTAPIRKMGCLDNQSVHSWFNAYSWQKDFASFDEFFANYA